MKKFEVADFLRSFGDVSQYGFNQNDVNALLRYLNTEPVKNSCNKSDMASYGFNGHQIHRLELLVKVVTQQIDLSDDELIRRHLAKLNNNSVNGKSNVKNFDIITSVPQIGVIKSVPYERWKLLNGKDGNGLKCKILKVGKDDVEVEIPQIIAIRRGESLKVKNVGEILGAGDGKMQLKLKAEFVEISKCYRYYLSSSVPTKITRYCCKMRTGEKFYVAFEEVTKGKISKTESRSTIGFSYGDNVAEYLYKYTLLACLMRSKNKFAKDAVSEVKSVKFTSDSNENLESLKALTGSDDWKKNRVMSEVLSIKMERPGDDVGL